MRIISFLISMFKYFSNENYIQLNNKIYRQDDCKDRRSPLSPIIANIIYGQIHN